MRAPAPIRRGFTLIELLIVIAVIAILATVMIPMVSAALNSQRRGKATGEVAALMGGCERYRKLYGDFPCARTGTPVPTTSATTDIPNFRRDLYLQLTGQQRLNSALATNGAVNLTLVDVTAGQERPLVGPAIVTAGVSTNGGLTPTDLSTCDEFIDPWGNAYDYRYRILAASSTSTGNTGAGTSYITWLSPDCLIVSCGAKFVESKVTGRLHVPDADEYWDVAGGSAAMPKQGTILATYYDDSATGTIFYRSDNITSFSGR